MVVTLLFLCTEFQEDHCGNFHCKSKNKRVAEMGYTFKPYSICMGIILTSKVHQLVSFLLKKLNDLVYEHIYSI